VTIFKTEIDAKVVSVAHLGETSDDEISDEVPDGAESAGSDEAAATDEE
jgi:hypothetical protein